MLSRRDVVIGGAATALVASCGGSAEVADPTLTTPATGSTNPASTALGALPTEAPPTTPPAPPSATWWLDGNFGPTTREQQAEALVVRGQLPEALDGLYVRNGPNPTSGTSPHWFVGDGMVHGVRLREGEAQWYRSRYIETPYRQDPAGTEGAIPGGAVSHANVSALSWNGRLLTMGEVGFPYEVDPETLDTSGVFDFDSTLQTAMTAHPKIDPRTGELDFFGYGIGAPFLTYHRTSGDTIAKSVVIDLPASTMIHDFAVTETDAVFMDLPVELDITKLDFGLPFSWNPDRASRIGLLDREATTDSTQWFDIDPCYVFHTVGAQRRGAVVTLQGVRYPTMWANSPVEPFAEGHVWEWALNTETGAVEERQINDRPLEFPTTNAAIAPSDRTRFYAASQGPTPAVATTSATVAHGLSGELAVYEHGDGVVAGEPLFVANPDNPIDDDAGWVLTYQHHLAEDTTSLAVFSAADIAAGPLAEVQIPHRVPHGFHATWHP